MNNRGFMNIQFYVLFSAIVSLLYFFHTCHVITVSWLFLFYVSSHFWISCFFPIKITSYVDVLFVHVYIWARHRIKN